MESIDDALAGLPQPEHAALLHAELDGFSVSKGTIRFTAEHPVPEALIKRLVAARLAEII